MRVRAMSPGTISGSGSSGSGSVRARVASTANIDLTAPGTAIDSVTLTVGDVFLAKDQTTPAQVGIYVFNGAASPATRSSSFANYNDYPGASITVQEGTVNSDTNWLCTSNRGGTIEVTPIVFALQDPSTATGTGSAVRATSPTINTPTLNSAAMLSATLTTPIFATAYIASHTVVAALDIDITKPNQLKSISANSTFTFSATPSTVGYTWGIRIENSATTVVRATFTPPGITSIRPVGSTGVLTSIVIPAQASLKRGVVDLVFRYDGTDILVYGAVESIDNLAASANPTVNDDSGDGYAVGSEIITTAGRTFKCIDSSLGAAKHRQGFMHHGDFVFASLPATALAGETANVTDIATGLTEFIWKTVKGATGWHHRYGTALKDVSTWTNLATGTTEQTCNQYQFAANLLRVGYRLRLYFGVGKTGTTDASDRMRIYWGVTGDATDQSSGWDGTNKLSAGARQTASWVEFAVISATTMALTGDSGGSNNAYSGGTGSSDPTVVFTIPNINTAMYVTTTLRMAGSTDTAQTGDWRLELLAC